MNTQENFYRRDDEIDLFELAGKLFKEKKTIIGCTAIAAVLSIATAMLLPKTYTASATISYSSTGRLQLVNSQILQTVDSRLLYNTENTQDGVSLTEQLLLTPTKAFNLFEKQLTSPLIHRQAFDESSLATNASTDLEKFSAYQDFEENLDTSLDTKSNTPRITLSYSSSTPGETADIINQQLIPLAQKAITTSLQNDQIALIKARITQLEVDIASLEASFKDDNLLKSITLTESLQQAKAAEIKQPYLANLTSTDDVSYLLGSNLLESRIDQLKNRKDTFQFYTGASSVSDNEKPYIEGVAEKVYQIQRLLQIEVDYSDLQPVTIEQQAIKPLIPIKPKKTLIVALGIILGGMLGVFIALIKIALNDRKKRKVTSEIGVDETSRLTMAE